MAIADTRRDRRKAFRLLAGRLLTSAALGTVIVAGFYLYNFLTTTDRFAVATLEFQGLDRVPASEAERLLADMKGENILLLPLESFEARFDRHPRIERVDLKKVLPSRVVCTVKEREPVALVYANRFLEVDATGMVMTADELSEKLDLPIVTGLEAGAVREGRPCRDPRLHAALEVLAVCKRHGGRFAENISELRVAKEGISVVSLEEGMVLLLGDSRFEERLKRFFLMKAVIAAKNDSAKMIDLRFEDQIVLRSGI